MSGKAHQPLEDALAISVRMLGKAEAGDWDALDALEAERGNLLALGHPDDARSGELLAELIACNGRIQAAVGNARIELQNALGENRQRHRAVSAYLVSARD
ncbi:MAG TPA: flagellar protein FliT [Luteibacter sp.]|jgi:hypothetical protein|nr:flagellar protein FliT [Luteibacter sp.]